MMTTSDGTADPASGSIRLQRFLARAGVASRRHSEKLIVSGRIEVNGNVVTELGTRVDPTRDVVSFDGSPVSLPDTKMYLLLNKPPGYLTTMHDPQGRPTIGELLPLGEGLFPVGRLDMDTTGALIVTSDGELAHKLMHPSFHAPKLYRVEVDGEVSSDDAHRLGEGIMLEDGMTRPADVEVVKSTSSASVVRITLREGRKRQVKRMFEAIGHPVTCLHRESFGPIGLEDLDIGEMRELDDSEVQALRETVGVG